MNETQLFAFEQDFVDSLRCIPMAVRLKLDVCGIKVSLRQWSRFTREDRWDLLMAGCETPGEIMQYRAVLTDLIAQRAQEAAQPLTEPPCRQWEDADRLPPVVAGFAMALGLSPPTSPQWAALTRLQRFALLKLTRDNHDNVNFAPAMREFGLTDSQAPRRRAHTAAYAG